MQNYNIICFYEFFITKFVIDWVLFMNWEKIDNEDFHINCIVYVSGSQVIMKYITEIEWKLGCKYIRFLTGAINNSLQEQ